MRSIRRLRSSRSTSLCRFGVPLAPPPHVVGAGLGVNAGGNCAALPPLVQVSVPLPTP